MLLNKNILLFLLISCFCFQVEAKKSFQIKRVHIEAEVHPNGSMTVSETRTYHFNGKFTYAYRQFPHHEGVRVTDFKVMADGRHLPLSDKEEQGHFVIVEKNKYIEVGWSFEARDEAKEFTITYTVEDIIKRHEDVAVLYYKFIDSQWKVDQQNVSLTIRYSGPYEELPANRHWLHGPAHAYSEIGADGEIVVQSHSVSKKDILEVRALYPPQWFQEVFQINNEVAAAIMAEEKLWADETNERRLAALDRQASFDKLYEWAPYTIFLLYALVLAIVFWIFKTYHSKEDVSKTTTTHTKPPTDLHPALINYLLYGYQLGNEINATLYLLAQKKIITIEDRNEEDKNLTKQLFWILNSDQYDRQKEGLKSFEIEVIDYLFAGGIKEIRFTDMAKSPMALHRMTTKFNQQVTAYGRTLGIWNRDSVKGMWIMVGLSAMLFLLFMVSIIFFKIWSLFVFLLCIVVVVLTTMIRHRSKSYQEAYYKWISYRKYLKSILGQKSNMAINYELVNEHLVYGTVFGLTKNQMVRLLNSVPRSSYHHYLYWYVILYGNRIQPGSMSKTISNMAGTIAGTQMSSVGGTGGGASFGGGGGFSAGGGGAR
ncbi:DUF2207 domain-containing protein [Anditalea andensis]|uniref:DUF2207 domain-containing protein n=1 Tax=Anditalea andensis TaxID=1048983 RepID=A0A074KZZ2_9BACT|nr:DUF2207 domain-containing protein [Anditalea andensis]KEO73790.1 hypothetical protein EL17_09780 [Anditalea andensis]